MNTYQIAINFRQSAPHFNFPYLCCIMLKIGIFGVGHLGKFHISNWKEIAGAEIIGFYDPNDVSAHEVMEKFGLKRFTDMELLLDEIDAADVVTPTQFHFSVCEMALRKSKHVFVEKPLANNMDEARKLLKLVSEAKVKFQVGHVERFNPAFMALNGKELQPMFIEVHRLAQFNPRGTEVSVILDLMIHDIDIILHLVKSDIKNISASGVAVMTDTPDIANARIEFNNGCVANLTSSRISMKKMRKMRLFQKDAYIGIDFLEKKTEIIRLKVKMKMMHCSVSILKRPTDHVPLQLKTLNPSTSTPSRQSSLRSGMPL